MQIPNPNSTGSIWGPVCGISGIVCAIFAFLLWAGITPNSLFSWRRSVVTPQGTKGKSALVAAVLSASLFLSGYSFYSWMHARHPVLAWVAIAALFVLFVVIWSVLLQGTRQSKTERTGVPDSASVDGILAGLP